MRSCKLRIVIAADEARGDKHGVWLAKLFARYAADSLAFRVKLSAGKSADSRGRCFLTNINRFVFAVVRSRKRVLAMFHVDSTRSQMQLNGKEVPSLNE